jgi:hypothetical protein
VGIAEDETYDNDENDCEDENEDETENEEESIPIKTWVMDIVKESEIMSTPDDGDHENAMYLPKVAKPLTQLMGRFPLWTGSMNRHFKTSGRPTSAPVESYFNELKNHQFDKKLPLRIDEFVQQRIKKILNSMKEASSLDFFHRNEELSDDSSSQHSIPESLEPCSVNVSEMNQEENWRGNFNKFN